MREYGNEYGRVGVEQMEYQAPTFGNDMPVMEGYDPSEIDHDAPYIPQNRKNVDPRQRYTQQPYQQPQAYGQPYDTRALNQQQQAAQQSTGPTYMDAQRNIERYDAMLNGLNGITATPDSSDAQMYGLGVAMESLHNAIKALKEVEYWVPKGKEHLVPKLTQAAIPIIDVLTKYSSALQRIQ